VPAGLHVVPARRARRAALLRLTGQGERLGRWAQTVRLRERSPMGQQRGPHQEQPGHRPMVVARSAHSMLPAA